MYASMTSPYRVRAKIRVTFTLMPAPMTAVIAGRPSGVAGILIITFGRPSRAKSSFACCTVASVSCASFGDTSIEMKPSLPPSASCTGRRMSAPRPMSSTARSQKVSSIESPACLAAAMASS